MFLCVCVDRERKKEKECVNVCERQIKRGRTDIQLETKTKDTKK